MSPISARPYRVAIADLGTALAGLGSCPSVLVVMDDADHLGAEAVNKVMANGVTAPHVSWLVATADSAVSAEFADGLGVPAIRLRPWSDQTVAQVARDHLGAACGRELLELLDVAGGVPLFVVGMIEGLEAEGRLRTVDGEIRPTSTRLPRRVLDLVESRVCGLSPKALKLLRVAAMLGTRFGVAELAGLIGESVAANLLELDEVLATGVLRTTGDRFAFDHELTRMVIARSVPALVQRALREDVDRVRTSAASRIDSDPEPVRAPHAVQAVGALAAAGNFAAATHLAEETLAQGVHDTSAAELRGLLAHLLLWRGDQSGALNAADEVIAGEDVPVTITAAAAAGRLLALSIGDEQRGRHEAERLLDGREGTADLADALLARGLVADGLFTSGDLVAGLRVMRETAARAATHPWWGAWHRLSLAARLGQLGLDAEAGELVGNLVPESDQWGLAMSSGRSGVERARLSARRGKLRDAATAVRVALSTAKQAGCPLFVPDGLAILAKAALADRDLPGAVQHVKHARAVAREAAVMPSVAVDWMDLRLTAETHGARAAVHLVETRMAGLVTSSGLYLDEPGAAAWLIDLGRGVGSRELANTALVVTQWLAESNPGFAPVAAAAVHARGLHDGDPELLSRAAAEHTDPWAAALAERNIAELATAGDQRPERLAVARPVDLEQEWDRLTDTQRGIARLAGAGMTNQQIARRVQLSPHTVNYHLRAMYRKLGISSRAELARFT
ncbi:helix-turn-helix domain-containing protein [Actinokineospora xionganensis]|uniref:HTH luxR-type domain-containing protein n=1 Tax=Actinokineospora xionganensis TaxID=2684470 RepID=A0ABR7L054_9PSEU|nr:helix-turn-helix transcriptional regulator [Actinokineospora xionganensis]MBC6445977.1 hypothetical protein [Actinokineospora xionganensis]